MAHRQNDVLIVITDSTQFLFLERFITSIIIVSTASINRCWQIVQQYWQTKKWIRQFRTFFRSLVECQLSACYLGCSQRLLSTSNALRWWPDAPLCFHQTEEGWWFSAMKNTATFIVFNWNGIWVFLLLSFWARNRSVNTDTQYKYNF